MNPVEQDIRKKSVLILQLSHTSLILHFQLEVALILVMSIMRSQILSFTGHLRLFAIETLGFILTVTIFDVSHGQWSVMIECKF